MWINPFRFCAPRSNCTVDIKKLHFAVRRRFNRRKYTPRAHRRHRRQSSVKNSKSIYPYMYSSRNSYGDILLKTNTRVHQYRYVAYFLRSSNKYNYYLRRTEARTYSDKGYCSGVKTGAVVLGHNCSNVGACYAANGTV